MATEIPDREIEIQEGYVGNLTPEQTKKLQELWTKFFEFCDKSDPPQTPSATDGSGAGGGDLAGWDEKKSGPEGAGIPKDDKAKDEIKARDEQAALDELLKKYGGKALRQTAWKFVMANHPDTDMLRFLRARKWDVSRAFAMLAGCMKWRLDNDVDALIHGGDLGNASIEKFLDQQRSGKTYALGTTDHEQPICYIHVKKHLTYGQPGVSMCKYVIYAMETFRLLMVPPNDKVVLLFDLTGFGLKNMDWNCILFIVKCLEAYYPESLGTLYIHNAPWLFSGIWKLLGPMLDPAVRNKVKFTKKPQDIDLVPAQRLAATMGGENVREFEFIEPREGENDRVLHDREGREERQKRYDDLAAEFEEVTKKWCANDSDEANNDRRALLVKKLRLAYLELDPYVRGQTVYHRNGTLDGQGIVTWEYEQKDGTVLRHVVGKKYCASSLREQIAQIEGGDATPGRVDPAAASTAGAAAAFAGASEGAAGEGVGAGAGVAVATAADDLPGVALDTPRSEEFHETQLATPEAAQQAFDADTQKVQQHDQHAADVILEHEKSASSASAAATATATGKADTAAVTEKLQGLDVSTTDVDEGVTQEGGGGGVEGKKFGSIKIKGLKLKSKIKNVVASR